ncbi:MAG TPA: FMN reductase [Candidatus Limnocylindrales bacterium]|jgi:FMN reductase
MADRDAQQGSSRTLVVVSAGLGQPSSTRLLADRLADATRRGLAAGGLSVQLETIELRDLARDLTDNLLTGFPSPNLKARIDQVLAADGLIAVTPIFSASYSGLFKLFFDVVKHDGLAGMPVLVAATAGTPRHSLALEHALRPLFAYLGAAVVPTAVFAAAEDWGEGDASLEHGLVDRVERAAGQLARAMAGPPRVAPPDPYDDPVPFERLLERRP